MLLEIPMIDNHIHTKLCKHAEGDVFEYVEKAIAKGIKEIAFTDHIPLPENFDLAPRMQIKEAQLIETCESGRGGNTYGCGRGNISQKNLKCIG